MTDPAWAASAQQNDDQRRCREQPRYPRAWRLVFGSVGLAFVCVVLSLAGTIIP